ncbi:MAG: hypothetical protein K5864_00535 [Bacteroidales bacterium]|nr:hypothetical protein [Bacteroidales bacterium]
MKKVLLILVALLPLLSQAQKLEVAQTTIVKKGMPLNQRQLDGIRFFEHYANHYYTVVETPDAFNIYAVSVKLVRYDDNLKKNGTLKLEALHNKDVLQISIVDGKMYLLVLDRKGRKDKAGLALGLSCCIVDLEAMEMKEMKLLGQMDREGQVMVARSADKAFYAVASQQWGYNIDNAHVWLYDNRFEVLWDRVVDCGTVSDIAVSDDGEVSLASVSKNRAIMTIVDVEDYVMGSVELGDNPAYSASLLMSDKNHIVVGGLLAQAVKKGDKVVNYIVSGYYGAALDLRTGKSQAEYRLFTDEELSVLSNAHIDKNHKKDRGYTDIHCRARTSTSYGGAMLLGMAYKEVIEMRNQNGMTTTQIFYRAFGSVLFGVDTTGAITWSRPMRRLAYTKDYNFVNEILVSRGDMCYLLMNENKSDSKMPYNIDMRASKTYIFHGSTPLSVYRVDARGNVDKKTTKKFPSGMGVIEVVDRPSDDRATLRVSSKKNTMLMDVELK